MKKFLLAVGAVSVLAMAGASAAQPAPGAPPAARGMGQHMQRMDPAKMAERRAQRLRDTLQLTPAQDGALRAFLDATQPKGDMRERMQQRRAEGPGATTPQRLERAKRMMVERQARFDQVSAATLRFYNQLTPAQQKAFDAQHGRGGKGMRGGRGHGGMRGPGGPGSMGGPPPK